MTCLFLFPLELKEHRVVRISKIFQTLFNDQEMSINFPYNVCVLVTSKSMVLFHQVNIIPTFYIIYFYTSFFSTYKIETIIVLLTS